MTNELLILSIRLWHPTISAESIISSIGCHPEVIQRAGEQKKTKKGSPLEGFYEQTYIAFEYLREPDSNLSSAIVKANKYLSSIKSFIFQFIASGGRIDYYISIVSQTWFAFEIYPELIQECADLQVSIGVEIFADIPRSEAD